MSECHLINNNNRQVAEPNQIIKEIKSLQRQQTQESGGIPAASVLRNLFKGKNFFPWSGKGDGKSTWEYFQQQVKTWLCSALLWWNCVQIRIQLEEKSWMKRFPSPFAVMVLKSLAADALKLDQKIWENFVLYLCKIIQMYISNLYCLYVCQTAILHKKQLRQIPWNLEVLRVEYGVKEEPTKSIGINLNNAKQTIDLGRDIPSECFSSLGKPEKS